MAVAAVAVVALLEAIKCFISLFSIYNKTAIATAKLDSFSLVELASDCKSPRG